MVCEDSNAQQTTEDSPLPASDLLLPVSERTPLGPGTPDAPTAGSATVTLRHHDVRESGAIATDELPGHTSSAMLRHQPQGLLAEEQRVLYSAYQEAYNKSTEQLEEDPLVNKNHSPGCDDSGVFLEEPIASSPETQPKSAAARLQNRLEKLSNESSKMRQYSIHEGLDSDAEKSDDLGLASSSIDSADDLDGDPLPSTLQIVSCPPVVPTRQKPPPVPARKCVTTSSDSQKNNRYYINEISTLEVPNQMKTPLSKSSSSGEDSNFGEGDHCINENSPTNVIISENSKNIINQQKNDQYRSSFAMTRSFHEEVLMNQQRELNPSQDSKSNFLARTLSSSSSARKLDTSNGSLGGYARRNSEQPSGFKWKSEECLRTAAESKWSLPGRRYEKSVSVKDRIAMFSEMEANQSTTKRDDLQRYGSENNIKAVAVSTDNKKVDMPPVDGNKNGSLLRDSKWHSMHSINKKYVEKEVPYGSSNLKPAMSIPSLAPNTESIPGNNYSILPVKLEVDPPKPIVSTYPETQLTNNKRYNYGLYSLKNLKNTEDLLSKKAAGSTLLSIIDSRKQPLQKLKGLVIPDKPYLSNNGKELPTIVSSDSDGLKESRRASLPVTVVTPCKTMSLPRNKKLECPPPQRQTSLSEPPWKNESNRSSNTLPKYSPAFKKRSLELPGSSLSPTPPSSITSPLSPPPSSPSSICSSNASSTLQQNVFQFSLTHSKPVQPLQPEKALMSPPSLPSDVEYEGDNSEDSSHSASPMRNSIRGSQDSKTSSLLNPGVVHYGKSNTFTSCARTVSHQPLKVETIMKASSVSESEQSKPKAAVYLSRTEISLKKEEQKRIESPQLDSSSTTRDPEFIENDITSNERTLSPQIYTSGKINNFLRNEMTSASNGISDDYFSKSQNGVSQNYMIAKAQECPFDVSVGKFHALPLSLKESEAKQTPYEKKLNKNGDCGLWTNGRPANSECEESDDDSHSTLSHRTEDSRHTTTDECLSDATTDSFEKPRLVPEPSHLQRATEDYASTEGYLSDASTTDVSLRRFTNRPLDSNAYSTEEYFSDATAESPDPDWISNRGSVVVDSHTRSYVKVQTSAHSSVHQRDTEGTDPSEKNVDPDLRPRRLSQQRTVLKAATQPSGSVQKFKALAEKWEQRSDVISPPPPPVVAVGQKKESRSGSISTTVVSSSVSSTVIKGKSTLPPSLMPRNSSSEKKSVSPSKQSSKDSMYASRTVTEREFTSSTDAVGTRRSSTTTTVTTETTTNGWNHHPYEEVCRVEPTTRRDSTSSSSSSSKTTLKEDEAFDSSPNHVDANNFELSKQEVVTSPSPSMNNKNDIGSSQSGLRSSSSSTRPCEETWNNEPRNRRGADFSRTSSVTDWPKATNRPSFGSKATFSVSDIRRSFENGSREPEKPSVAKMPPMPAARNSTPAAPPPVTSKTVRRQSSSIDVIEEDEELRRLMDGARNQLFQEGAGNQLHVLAVVLHREGEGGGSVGITLAGGADYEVKEITVHKVIGGSIADRDGRVLKGDRVMSINGRDLRGVSHGEALHILKAPSPRVLLVLARDKNGISIQMNGTEKETKRVQDYDINRDSETFVVELQKDAAGLGFSIEGGRDSPQGDRPLLIKRIFKGGAADKDGQLEEGDEILAVNEHPVSNMTRTEAWNFLKKLPEGPVVIKARKTLLR